MHWEGVGYGHIQKRSRTFDEKIILSEPSVPLI